MHFPFRSFTFRSNVLCPWCIIARGWSYKISLFYAIEIWCTWWKIKVSLQVFFSSSLLPNFCDIFKGENCNSTKIEILHISVRNFVEISVLKQKHKNVYSFFTLSTIKAYHFLACSIYILYTNVNFFTKFSDVILNKLSYWPVIVFKLSLEITILRGIIWFHEFLRCISILCYVMCDFTNFFFKGIP